jgi:hypothetical protein
MRACANVQVPSQETTSNECLPSQAGVTQCANALSNTSSVTVITAHGSEIACARQRKREREMLSNLTLLGFASRFLEMLYSLALILKLESSDIVVKNT